MSDKFVRPRWFELKRQWTCGRLMPVRYALGATLEKWLPNHFPEEGRREYFGDGAHGHPSEEEALEGLTRAQVWAYRVATAMRLSGY